MNTQLFKTVLVLFMTALWTTSALAIERLVIPGTGDSQKLLRVAALRFEQEHPEVTIDIPESVGSVGGIKRVLNGHSPLARIARSLDSKEQASGLSSIVFAYTPVVFVANLPEKCVDNLSSAELVAIYSGETTSWQKFGKCPDHKIYVANREEGDSSRILIEANLPDFKNIPKLAGKIVYSTPETLQILEDHPYTIGYLPLAILRSSPLTRFAINNLHPTVENIVTNSYQLAVPLGFVWKEKPTGRYHQFVEFLFSPRGQEIIRDHGAVPVPKRSGP